jgi:GNAT superfamily N-acetyltransferase
MQLRPLSWLHKVSRHQIDTSAEQEVTLRRAARICNLPLADFILKSACDAAELAIQDQRQFFVAGHERLQMMAQRVRHPLPPPGLTQLFSTSAPWQNHSALQAPQALRPEHATLEFDCDKLALNDWLIHRALQAQQHGVAKTFVVCAQQRVAAYFSLCVGQIDSQEIPRGHHHADDFPVPVVILTRLAVDKLYQGKGLGTALLAEAIHHTLAISEQAAVEALLTQPFNESAARFYQRHGFTQSPAAYKQLALLIKDIEAARQEANRAE